MFGECKIVTTHASPRAYRAQDAVPGDFSYRMSAGSFTEFKRCPRRWIAAKGEPRRPADKWRELLECLLLTPRQTDMRFAFRPATYVAKVLTCPACGSVTDAAICRRCNQRRRPKEEVKPWSAKAEYCAKWQAQAEERNQTTVKAEDMDAAKLAVDRLLGEREIAEFGDGSQLQVWVQGEWRDQDTKLVIPLRALIGYCPNGNGHYARALGAFRTPRDAGHGMWARTCYFGAYHVYAALALDLYNHATDEDRNEFYFVLSESLPPYEPARRQLSSQFIGLGRKTYHGLLSQYARCLKHNVWPGYDLNEKGDEIWSVVDLEPWMEQGKVDASTVVTDEPGATAASAPRSE